MPFGLQTVLEGIKLLYLAINNSLRYLQSSVGKLTEVQDAFGHLHTLDEDSLDVMLVLQVVNVVVQVIVSRETIVVH